MLKWRTKIWFKLNFCLCWIIIKAFYLYNVKSTIKPYFWYQDMLEKESFTWINSWNSWYLVHILVQNLTFSWQLHAHDCNDFKNSLLEDFKSMTEVWTCHIQPCGREYATVEPIRFNRSKEQISLDFPREMFLMSQISYVFINS